MQDEHFMQLWNAGHARFSDDLTRIARKAFESTAQHLREKRKTLQECPFAHQARLTGIGMVAGVLAGSTIALMSSPTTNPHCGQANPQVCQIAATPA